MGCRQSRAFDPDESNVDPLRSGSHQEMKLKKVKRRKVKEKSRRQNFVSAGSGEVECSGSNNGESAAAEDPLTKKDMSQKKRSKNVNERAKKVDNKSSGKAQAVTVDTSDTAEMDLRQDKLGANHVFPRWKTRCESACKCVNTHANDASSNQGGGHRSEKATPRLCKKCTEATMNNKRRYANNGATSNNSIEANGGAELNGTAGSAGGDGSDLPCQVSSRQDQLAAIVSLLALAALDLSAPASSVLVKNRKNAWIQLAGHPGSFAPAGPNTIWKKRISKENYEVLAYTALSEYPQSTNIMPTFYREVEFNGEYFIEIEDLLHHFCDPSIMDIKMGTRTFLEAEVKNPVLRKDLFEKMVKVDPNAPTAEELAEGAITKLRYMQFREQESSTASLGFRIEAIRMSGETPNTNLKKVKTREDVSYFLETFLRGHEVVIPSLYKRLCDIREKYESVPFFKSHEVIGSSLLIMYDSSNQAGAWMIDFAKTIPVADVTLNHRSLWKPGNHEDGYLFGLDSLIEIFHGLVEKHKGTVTDSGIPPS